jgi:hypothetical protein
MYTEIRLAEIWVIVIAYILQIRKVVIFNFVPCMLLYLFYSNQLMHSF